MLRSVFEGASPGTGRQNGGVARDGSSGAWFGGTLGGPTSGRSGAPEGRAFPLTQFQEEGVRRLRQVLRSRGGAILADGVGLGKTYVALALIEEALRAGHEAVVVVPAALRAAWKGPLQRLRRAGPDGSEAPYAIRVVSHAQLSRGASVPPPRRPRIVVVDEAHRFRNPATRRYRALARMLQGRAQPVSATELLLLTAAPVNNGMDDLYHLVRLFLPDDGLKDAGVPSLRAAFQRESRSGAGGAVHRSMSVGSDARAVRTTVRELVVRRTRRMVHERFGNASPPGADVRFPRRAPLAVVTYEERGIPDRVRSIEALELMAYGPGAAPLLRLGLLKRMDSSLGAFHRSLRRLRTLLEDLVEAAERGRMLVPGSRPGRRDSDPLQRLLLGVLADRAPPDMDLRVLAASARRDIRSADTVLAKEPGPDRKALSLEGLLDRLNGDKVVVFTEYRDTAEILWRALVNRFRVGRVDGAGAWLGGRPAGRAAVVHRFAPASNRRRLPVVREQVDVLIATDVLSEGLNLQDARHVVSYDLPWNPVRLLQRIGRVDRLGSLHDVVFSHLFVPDQGLDEVLGLTRRLRKKLDGITGSVGPEAADDLMEGLARGRLTLVETALESAADRDTDEPWEALRTLWLRHGAENRMGRESECAEAQQWVGEARVPAGPAVLDIECVALVALGVRAQLLEVDRGDRVGPADRDARAVIETAITGDGMGSARTGGPDPDLVARARGAARHVREFLDTEGAASRAPVPLWAGDAGSRLARQVRESLARSSSQASPETVRTAEVVLGLLARPLLPGLEAEIDAFLAHAPIAEYGPQELISQASQLLRVDEQSATSRPPVCQSPGLVGSIRDHRPQKPDSRPRIQALLLVTRRSGKPSPSPRSDAAPGEGRRA